MAWQTIFLYNYGKKCFLSHSINTYSSNLGSADLLIQCIDNIPYYLSSLFNQPAKSDLFCVRKNLTPFFNEHVSRYINRHLFDNHTSSELRFQLRIWLKCSSVRIGLFFFLIFFFGVYLTYNVCPSLCYGKVTQLYVYICVYI